MKKYFFFNYIPNLVEHFDFRYKKVISRFNRTHLNIEQAWLRYVWEDNDAYKVTKTDGLRIKIFFFLISFVYIFFAILRNFIEILFKPYYPIYFCLERNIYFVWSKIIKAISHDIYYSVLIYIYFRFGIYGIKAYDKQFSFQVLKYFFIKICYLSETYRFYRDIYLLFKLISFSDEVYNFFFVYFRFIISLAAYVDWDVIYGYNRKIKTPNLNIYYPLQTSLLSILVRLTGLMSLMSSLLFLIVYCFCSINLNFFYIDMVDSLTLVLGNTSNENISTPIFYFLQYLEGSLKSIIIYFVENQYTINLIEFYDNVYIPKHYSLIFFFIIISIIIPLIFFIFFFHIIFIVKHNYFPDFDWLKIKRRNKKQKINIDYSNLIQ